MRRTAVAAALAALTFLPAGPASAAPQPRLVPTCAEGRPGFDLSFRQDGSVAAVSSAGGSYQVPSAPGDVTVVVAGPAGAGYRLLDAAGSVLATATGADVPCDGWAGRADFLARSNLAGSPQAVGDLAAVPVRDGGLDVFRGGVGSLYVDPITGRGHVVRGAVRDRYAALGGPGGPLGRPTGSEYRTAAGNLYTAFEHGAVLWSAATGAHAVVGPQWTGYLARERDTGLLGLPVGERFGPLAGGGSGQAFTGGSLYSSPATGTWAVRGAVRDRWAQLGWETGVLGYPAGDEAPAGPRGDARVQVFQRATVYYDPTRGARFVRGVIRDAYAAHGGPGGPGGNGVAGGWSLGYPVTDEVLLPGGAYSAFDGGSVYFSPATGAHVVSGSVLRGYAQRGWETGELGYPVSDTLGDPGVPYAPEFQHFQGGSIYSYKPGPSVVKGAVRDAYWALGAQTCPLGYPWDDEQPGPGGGVVQHFRGGSITWTPTGGAVVAFGT